MLSFLEVEIYIVNISSHGPVVSSGWHSIFSLECIQMREKD